MLPNVPCIWLNGFGLKLSQKLVNASFYLPRIVQFCISQKKNGLNENWLEPRLAYTFGYGGKSKLKEKNSFWFDLTSAKW